MGLLHIPPLPKPQRGFYSYMASGKPAVACSPGPGTLSTACPLPQSPPPTHPPTWSPWACLPMVIGFVQPVTRRGMFLQMIGSLKTVPPRMFLMVPLGLRHIFFSLNSGEFGGRGRGGGRPGPRQALSRGSPQPSPGEAGLFLQGLPCPSPRKTAGLTSGWIPALQTRIPHLPSTRASSGVMVAHLTATLYF